MPYNISLYEKKVQFTLMLQFENLVTVCYQDTSKVSAVTRVEQYKLLGTAYRFCHIVAMIVSTGDFPSVLNIGVSVLARCSQGGSRLYLEVFVVFILCACI